MGACTKRKAKVGSPLLMMASYHGCGGCRLLVLMMRTKMRMYFSVVLLAWSGTRKPTMNILGTKS